MTQEDCGNVFRIAFSNLVVKECENLRYHAKELTPICCGQKANLFADGRGAG